MRLIVPSDEALFIIHYTSVKIKPCNVYPDLFFTELRKLMGYCSSKNLNAKYTQDDL